MFKTGLSLLAIAGVLQPGLVAGRNIFHFGDSYSATSFDYQKTLPSTDNPLGNPTFPGNTILGQGTPGFIGYLINENPSSGGSPTFVYNYACFGARVNNTMEPGNDPSHTDMTEQYSQFQSQKHLLDPNSDVVSVYFGTNDINAYLADTLAYGPIMDSMRDVLEQLYDDGARRFIFFAMDPLYRTPGYVNGDNPINATVAAAIGVFHWNFHLRRQAAQFGRAHGDVRAEVFDTAPVFNKVLDDPKANGAPDNQCHNTDATSCLWYDTLHPGAAIQKALAAGFKDTLASMNFW